MWLIFEWDPTKALHNERKHGVSFDEAKTAFADASSLTIHDPEHSDAEDRYVLLGMSAAGRLLVVVHVERGDNIRLISARTADRREAAKYTWSQ
ncbi:MAG: BrnT family toxin [Gammaproteobacteria bacterium]